MLCEVVLVVNGLTLFLVVSLVVIFRKEINMSINMGMNLYNTYSKKNKGHEKLMSDIMTKEGLPPSDTTSDNNSKNKKSLDKTACMQFTKRPSREKHQ